jgi:hypothetical protein
VQLGGHAPRAAHRRGSPRCGGVIDPGPSAMARDPEWFRCGARLRVRAPDAVASGR